MSERTESANEVSKQPGSKLGPYLLLWLQWVGASVVAGFAGLIAGIIMFTGAIALIIVLDLHDAGIRPLQVILSSLVVGGFIGLSLATVQKLLIQRYVRLPSWYIRSSTIGALLALLLSSFNEIGLHPIAPPIVAAAGGAIFGFSQWLAIRRGLQNSGWWVLANLLAWGSGGTVMYGLVEAWTYRGGADPIPGEGIFLDRCGLPMVCVATAAAITGIALVWLLRASALIPLADNKPSQPPHSTSPS